MRSPAHLVFTRRCGLARSGPGTEPVQADSRVTHTASLEGRPSSVVYGASSPNRAALTRRRNRPGQRALAFGVTLPRRSKAPAGSHWPAGRAAPRGAFGNTRGRWAPAGVWSVWVSWVASRAGGGPVGGMPRSPCQETRRPSPVRRDAGRPIQAAPVDLGASSPERGENLRLRRRRPAGPQVFGHRGRRVSRGTTRDRSAPVPPIYLVPDSGRNMSALPRTWRPFLAVVGMVCVDVGEFVEDQTVLAAFVRLVRVVGRYPFHDPPHCPALPAHQRRQPNRRIVRSSPKQRTLQLCVRDSRQQNSDRSLMRRA